MSSKPIPDPVSLRDALAPARGRLAPTPRGMALRAKTSTRVRRLVPTRLAVLRAERRGRDLWDSCAEERSRALAAMQAVLGATALEARVEEFARAQLVENHVQSALFWQPWRAPLLEDESRLQLAQARESGRGIILSSCHLHNSFLMGWAVRNMGIELYAAFGDWFFQAPGPDLAGRRLERWRRGTASLPIRGRGSFETLSGLLDSGAAVLLMYDMPGSRPTRYLGKPAELADGTARLGVLTQATVLPMHVRRVGHRVVADVGAPVGQRHMDEPAALHEQLARIHERWILQNAAAMQGPRDFGWEDGATAGAWRRPDVTRSAAGPDPVSEPRIGYAMSGAAGRRGGRYFGSSRPSQPR
ncbi:MAG: hypothetical protein ACLP8S_04735 [Solirubrobacteraceae bacterium]